jgi:drug/metabolite transporter (DMT)-like permease
MLPRTTKAGVIALLAASFLWGLSFLATKIALSDVGPLTINMLRTAIALAVLAPFARRAGYRFKTGFKAGLFLYGFTGIALAFSLQNIGIRFSSATNGALIDAGQPALVIIFSYIWLKEQPTTKRIAGVILSIGGVIMITLNQPPSIGPSYLTGNLLLIAGIVVWGIFIIQGKTIVRGHSSFVATAASFQAGLLFLIPLSAGEILMEGVPNFTLNGLLAVLYLGLGPSAIAFLLWNFGLKHVDATASASFMNLIPVIGLAAAYLWGEPISMIQLAGGAVVIAGIWICNS